MSEALDIIYQDEYIVAVHKPAGLLVHRSDIDRHETRFAVQQLRDQIGKPVFPAHRLDKATSGLMLFALDSESCQRLMTQFAELQVDKTYWAIVRGWPAEQGVIDHPLTRIKDPYDKPRQKFEAQDALTGFKRLQTFSSPIAIDRYPEARYALVEAKPKTGRRHQIRRHLKHISHPIIGDVRYGKGNHNRLFREQLGIERMLLACTAMAFNHPSTGARVALECPVEASFQTAIEKLGLR
ncbi:pseudouridine synthase [Permianibacter aggregans]|uniref:tRNA pseudouridine synthase C n=1 Tax=Permianibacter aggregans TaxID=1510150 RepID=A0A4R6UVQ5_9GAMM|nr:pseudouridine synthase [Permianibacter aggregans]QGX41517.1 pseudouridylate synthase [Permianibacter aggregans]TDQ51311.1 tRNA pseudouridine synthase C [Permianibacter aggregans]